MEREKEWITPPNHVGFLAKRLFGASGEIAEGSIARIQKGGGGPAEAHTHAHGHLFIVVQGVAEIRLGEKKIVLRQDESFLVEGTIPHSVWNGSDSELVMIGITVRG